MKPRSRYEYAEWKDKLYGRARQLIEQYPESFTHAGKTLAQTFSCEFIRKMDADNPASPRHDWAPERLLITRICNARSAAIGQSEEYLVAKLDFRFIGKIKKRLCAAHQAILAILLASDPDANDYIPQEMCELASLQYETVDAQVLGRGFLPWTWRDQDLHLCPGSTHHGLPTPHALATLEAAINLIDPQTTQPTTQQELRVDEPENPLDQTLIQLEEKEINLLKWLGEPSQRNRTIQRLRIFPDDPSIPTDQAIIRAMITKLHGFGLVYGPPRKPVRITENGLAWLKENIPESREQSG